jgi:hypothetical protein
VPFCAAAFPQNGIDFGAMRPYDAQATDVTGQVSRMRDSQPWALSSGEQVPVHQVITTGPDGYARFVVGGGSNFELFGNSRVIFRSNTAQVGDLLDVVSGRVRVHVQPGPGQWQQRIFTPEAVLTARQPATAAIAIDEDNTIRVDVLEGQFSVSHKLLPDNNPVIVKAIDAILIRPDERISRRVDRGSLYRYTAKSLHNLWASVTRANKDTPDQKFLAESHARPVVTGF